MGAETPPPVREHAERAAYPFNWRETLAALDGFPNAERYRAMVENLVAERAALPWPPCA